MRNLRVTERPSVRPDGDGVAVAAVAVVALGVVVHGSSGGCVF